MLAQLIPHLALGTAMCIWSTSFLAGKVALMGGYTPAQLMAVRMFAAVLLFTPAFPSLWRALKRNRRWLTVAAMLLCEPCLYFLFEAQALRYTTASQAGMVSAILPVIVAVVALFVLKERTGVIAWVGFAMAAGGVIWLTAAAESTETAPNPLLGNVLEMAAMTCGAFYTIFLKKLTSVYSPVHLTAMQAASGFLFFMPQALLEGGFAGSLMAAGWKPMAMAVYLGTAVSILGYGLYNYGVGRVRAGQAGAYINMMPVVTMGLGVMLLNDLVLPSQYMASAVVIVGILLSQYIGGTKQA